MLQVNWKKLKRFLKLNDWVWSIPLSLAAVLGTAFLAVYAIGDGFAPYPLNTIHLSLYALTIMVIGNMAAQLGMIFNSRVVHTEYYNVDNKQEYTNLPIWQKIKLYCFWYVFYSLEYLLVWAILV